MKRQLAKREIIRKVLQGEPPPYVPWHCGFTLEARQALAAHLGTDDLDGALDNHFVKLGGSTGFFTDLGNNRVQDHFGVVWNRSIDKDIGIVEGCLLPEPTLRDYNLPDPRNPRFFKDIPGKIEGSSDCFRVFCVGFSLFERAWTLRGMENVLADFYEHPEFLHRLFDTLCDYNIEQVREALHYDIDAVYFGDDWGQQRGLLMGPRLWREFIYPRIRRMYQVTRDAGKYQLIHSCGDIDELFDDLIAIGVNCVNPLQPEVLDVETLIPRYRGRLSFHGGLSTQRTLPGGTPEDVRKETRRLLELGREGNYIFAPAHAVEGDAPLENMLAFIDELHGQPGYQPPSD